jgi:hypothetical protein
VSVTLRCRNARAALGYSERRVATALFDGGLFLADIGSVDTLVVTGMVMVAVLVGMLVVACDKVKC